MLPLAKHQMILSVTLAFLGISFAVTKTEVKRTRSSSHAFVSGKQWLDTNGEPIEAHGGGILRANGIYYWYGENHRFGTGNKTGISVYSSRDLYSWKNEGIALPKSAVPEQFRDSGVCERPKVLYNALTRKYVMWMHLDNGNYTSASAGVAISDSPTGPFRFIGHRRPIAYDYGIPVDDALNERSLGPTFRDMTLFQDDDGVAYVVYAAENNQTMYLVRLNDAYTEPESPAVEGKTWARILPKAQREAPALFKYRGRYYLFTSGLTGWAPNPGEIASADNLLGPWERIGNPFSGKGADTSYQSQPTFILPVPGHDGAFIYMGDRWVGHKLEDSTYVWLPFVIRSDRILKLAYLDRWNLSVFADKSTVLQAPSLEVHKDLAFMKLRWGKVSGADHYTIYRDQVEVGTTSRLEYQVPEQLAGRSYQYCVSAANIFGAISDCSRKVTVRFERARAVRLSDIEPDSWHHGFGPLQRDKGVDGGPIRIAGHIYRKGIGTHAPSEIIYRVAGRYSTFEALVGVDNALKAEYPWKPSSVEFKVFLDGRLEFESGVMLGDTPPKRVRLSLKGIRELKLIVTDGSDGTHYDHADWAEARLVP